jgi:hypothetical protein
VQKKKFSQLKIEHGGTTGKEFAVVNGKPAMQ